jgi:hypothetical protein
MQLRQHYSDNTIQCYSHNTILYLRMWSHLISHQNCQLLSSAFLFVHFFYLSLSLEVNVRRIKSHTKSHTKFKAMKTKKHFSKLFRKWFLKNISLNFLENNFVYSSKLVNVCWQISLSELLVVLKNCLWLCKTYNRASVV